MKFLRCNVAANYDYNTYDLLEDFHLGVKVKQTAL